MTWIVSAIRPLRSEWSKLVRPQRNARGPHFGDRTQPDPYTRLLVTSGCGAAISRHGRSPPAARPSNGAAAFLRRSLRTCFSYFGRSSSAFMASASPASSVCSFLTFSHLRRQSFVRLTSLPWQHGCHPEQREGSCGSGHTLSPNRGARSSHLEFIALTNSSLRARLQPLICFSRAMAF